MITGTRTGEAGPETGPPADAGTGVAGTADAGTGVAYTGISAGTASGAGAHSGTGPGAGVRATARIRAAADAHGVSRLPVLEGEGPFALRRTRSVGSEARVTIVGAMSAPLGGDRLAIEAEAGPGARLDIGSAAATIALPGQSEEPARYDVHLTVAEGAELRWLPEQLISAQGSALRVTTRAELAPGARLLLREEQVLGRAGEGPGALTSRLTVRYAGRTVLDQELACGPGAPGGWDGPAALAGHRALGQLVVVRPELADEPVAPRMLGELAALTPLAGPVLLVTAVAADALRLRRVLDEAVRLVAW